MLIANTILMERKVEADQLETFKAYKILEINTKDLLMSAAFSI